MKTVRRKILLLILICLFLVGSVAILSRFLPYESANGFPLNLEIWLKVWTTGYTAEDGFTGKTALGYQAGWGICAIDPDYIPYGSILYLPEYSELCNRLLLCVDTGSLVKGYHIDVWTETNEQAYSLTGEKKVRILRWGWGCWLVNPNDWGLR